MFGIIKGTFRYDKLLIVGHDKGWSLVLGDNFTRDGNVISDFGVIE